MRQIHRIVKGNKFHIIITILLAILVSSCSIRRFVPEGKYLVKKNSIVIEDNDSADISKSSLSSYIVLKPYKTAMQTNFPNWVYYKSERRPNSKFWKWMNRSLGREPIYYDPQEADRSARQMTLYLNNVGHFNSKVTHTVKTTWRRKAKVKYHVKPTQPYRINNLEYLIDDSLMERYVMRDSARFGIAKGDIYNAYLLSDQRDMMTERLKNSGYYYFNRNLIHYDVDSNYMNHTLSVTMHMEQEGPSNKQYQIKDIKIYPNYSIFRMNEKPSDSASLTVEIGRRKLLNTLDFYYFGKPNVKPSTFKQSIQVIEGFPYNLRSVTNTYQAINNFSLFNNVNIQFDSVPNDSLNLLDCRITMQQSDRHSFTVQAEGTRSDADLGIKGSFSYTNRNIFHGAEVFRLSLKTGIEAQKLVRFGETENSRGVFNTREFGISASLMFPKFLSPIKMTNFSRDFQPTTSVALGFNSQVRYYYSRYINSASYSYDWKTNYRLRQTFSPIYLNSVKIDNVNPTFQEFLDAETNQRKKDQYTSHLIFGTRYSFIYNTQRITQKGSFFYFRADLESSGNLLSLLNNTRIISDSEGYHEFWGIRYAQYLRNSFDVRQHIDLGHDSWLVFRQYVGLGLPYGNSKDLPFERSFYAGGANSLRGWIYRGVGPGGYVPTDDDIEKIGDMQLELNAEYRFPLYNIVNGAIFVDAGNVWTYNANEAMPGGEFKFNEFYKQIALDAGIGFRVDVSFLIIRVDLAYALRNPYRNINGSYWRFDDTDDDNLRLNLGIGYPF